MRALRQSALILSIVTQSSCSDGQSRDALSFQTSPADATGHLTGTEAIGARLSLTRPSGNFGVNLVDLGAVGDGIQDNTATFQKALDEHDRIYLPASENGYVVNGTLRVNKPVIITGDNTTIKTTSKLLFNIAADKVTVRELVIKHDRASQGVTFKLDTSSRSIEKIYLEHLEIYDAKHGIVDSRHKKNIIVNLHVSDVNFFIGQHSQILLEDAFAFIFFSNVTFGFARLTDFELNFPVVSITDNVGSVFTDVHINSNGVIPAQGLGVGFSFKNSRAITLTRTMSDTLGGRGFVFSEAQYVHLTDVVASLNSHGGFLFNQCSFVQGSNLVATGRVGAPPLEAPRSAHGVVIRNSDNLQFTNLSSRNNTGFPVVIDTNSRSLRSVNEIFTNNGANVVGGGGGFE